MSGMLFLLILVFGYLKVLDGTYVNPPMVYDGGMLKTDRDVYAPGDVVSVFIDCAKLRAVPGRITWQLVNGRIFPYATRDLSYAVGSYEKWVTLDKERLPTANLIEDGEYHYEAVVEKQVNPLRTVTYVLRTVDFRIRSEP